MTHEELVELAFKLPDLQAYDFEIIDSMDDATLYRLLKIQPPSSVVSTRKPKTIRQRLRPPEKVATSFVEKKGKLHRLETWRFFDAEGQQTYKDEFIRCGNRVMFEGRLVSSSIVLHWLRTGEKVSRVVKPAKPFKAAVRVGAKVKHLGYFASKEERDAAVLMYRLTQSIANPLGDK